MNAPLTHATVRGLALLRGVSPERLPHLVTACESRPCYAYRANWIRTLDLRDTIPTCPRCAVLRDAALEGREVTSCGPATTIKRLHGNE